MFGKSYWTTRAVAEITMNPFSSGRSTDGADGEGSFDDPGTFVSDHVPEPGDFLEGHDVLEGEDHVAFHDITRELFEERGVYDATFGYNLARLNLDRRHPEAGYRYTVDTDDPTAQSERSSAPRRSSVRRLMARQGLVPRLERPQSESLNETLEPLELQYRELGDVPTDLDGQGSSTGLTDRGQGEDDSAVRSPF